MQRVLECPVCLLIFDTKTRAPKTLSCGHSLCSPCLGNVLKGSSISCPKCRTNCHVPHGQVDKLPTNFSTLDTLDTACEGCQDQLRIKRCSHCKLNLCQSCIHKHQDVPHPSLTAALLLLEKQLTKLQEKLSRDNVIDQIHSQGASVITEINKTYEQRIEQLKQEHQQRLTEARGQIEHDSEEYLTWQEKINNSYAEIKSFLGRCRAKISLKEAESENSDQLLAQCHQKSTALGKLKKTEPKITKISFHSPDDNFDNLLSTCGKLVISTDDITGTGSTDGKSHISAAPDKSTRPKPISKKHKSSPHTSSLSIGSKDQLSVLSDRSARPKQIPSKQRHSSTTKRISSDDTSQLIQLSDRLARHGDISVRQRSGAATQVTSVNSKDSQLMGVPDYTAARYSQMIGGSGSGPGPFCSPCGITTSPVSNTIIVADTDNHRVHILTETLQPVSVFGCEGNKDGQFDLPYDVAVSKDDKIFVSDCHNNRVQVTDNTGSFLYKFGTKGSGSNQLIQPRGLAIDHNDLVYICDSNNHRIQITSLKGQVIMSVGSQGESTGQFMSCPKYIAVSKKDKLVVSDGDGNLYILTTKGIHIQTIKANQPPQDISVRGVAMDGHDNIIIAHYKPYGPSRSSCIMVLSETGDVITTIGTRGIRPGEMAIPQAVAITKNGDILVNDIDWNISRVQLYIVPVQK